MKRSSAPLFVAFILTGYCLAAPPPKGLLTATLIAIDDIRAENVELKTAEDGTQYISMRLHLAGADAVRVHITEMQLSPGQTLTFSNKSGTEVHGPFEASGPTECGDFWSDAIAGPDIIVELGTGPEGAGDLPFKVDVIEAAKLSEVMPPPPNNLVKRFENPGIEEPALNMQLWTVSLYTKGTYFSVPRKNFPALKGRIRLDRQ